MGVHIFEKTDGMTTGGVDIRAFTRDDWEAVCDVYEAAAMTELTVTGADPRAFRPMPLAEDLEQFSKLNTAMVACAGDRVVGFVAWRDRGEWRGSGYLSWLYVDPARHRRGIGGRLLGEAMAALGDEAWTLVRVGNEPAIGLYSKLGMQIVKRRQAGTERYPHAELRMALPTSRRFDPDVPDFGV